MPSSCNSGILITFVMDIAVGLHEVIINIP
jgi:hypothetical protein